METGKGWAEAAGDDEGPDDGCDYWDGRVTNADFARARAAAEGWRRVDQPDPEPVDLDAEVEAGLPD